MLPASLAVTGALAIAATGRRAVAVADRGRRARRSSTAASRTCPAFASGHFTLTERPTGCTVVLVDGDGAVGRRVAARRRAGHARDRPARSAEHGRPGQRDRARRRQRLRPRRGAGRRALPRRAQASAGTSAPPASCRSCRRRSSSTSASAATRRSGRPPTAATRRRGRGDRRRGAGRQRRRRRRRHGRQDGRHGTAPMKGGIGSAAIALPNGLVVGAIVAVNAVGDIIDPATGQGRRRRRATRTASARRRPHAAARGRPRRAPRAARRREHDDRPSSPPTRGSTKAEINRVALMADDGLARAINPSHTDRRRRHGVRAGDRPLGRRGQREHHRRARGRSAGRSHRARGGQARSRSAACRRRATSAPFRARVRSA